MRVRIHWNETLGAVGRITQRRTLWRYGWEDQNERVTYDSSSVRVVLPHPHKAAARPNTTSDRPVATTHSHNLRRSFHGIRKDTNRRALNMAPGASCTVERRPRHGGYVLWTRTLLYCWTSSVPRRLYRTVSVVSRRRRVVSPEGIRSVAPIQTEAASTCSDSKRAWRSPERTRRLWTASDSCRGGRNRARRPGLSWRPSTSRPPCTGAWRSAGPASGAPAGETTAAVTTWHQWRLCCQYTSYNGFIIDK